MIKRLKPGDTIRCKDKEDAIKHMNDIESAGYATDFKFEKNGERGIWIEVMDDLVPEDVIKEAYRAGYEDARQESLPSAQPEQRSFSCGQENDLISRQAAIDALGTPHGILYPIRTIEELPSAQPETANIIVGKSRDGMTMWYQCDNCNEPVDENDLYCRGCGRKFING